MPRAWLQLLFDKAFYVALGAFFFLLPLQTRYIFREAALYEYGTLSLYVIEILGWVAILSFLPHRRKFPISNFQFPILIFALFSFLSIAWAADKAIALQAAVRLIEGVLLYVVIKNFVGNWKLEIGNYIIWAFLAGAVLQASLGIYQFLTQSSFASTLLGMALHDPQALGTAVVEFGNDLPAQAGRWLRAYGGLPHPNVLGGYLVVALGVLMLLIWRGRASVGSEARPPYIALAIAPVLLTGIFFSFSRAAWVGVIVVIGWLIRKLWQERKNSAVQRETTKLTIVSFVVALVGYAAFLTILYRPLVTARIFPESRLEVKSRVERVQGVSEAWRIIKAHPLVGVGIGNYTQALQQLRSNQPPYSYQPVHNVPLLVFSELGIVGLLFFVATLYLIVKQSTFAVLLFYCFVVLLMADHYLWTLLFGILLFWPILGLFTIIHRPRT